MLKLVKIQPQTNLPFLEKAYHLSKSVSFGLNYKFFSQVFKNFHKFFQVSYANTGENTASDESAKLAASIDEIKRLQETASALRHENLQLKVWRGILYYYTIN